MHTTHGRAASVSSVTANGNTTTTTSVQKPVTNTHVHASSTSSFSSASVVTAKRASSVSATGRTSLASARAQSPQDASLIALRAGREPGHVPSQHRRRRSVAVDSSERGSIEGIEHLNRWSANSSTPSLTSTKRNRASSGAVMPSIPPKSFSTQKSRTGGDSNLPSATSQRSSTGRPVSPKSHAGQFRLSARGDHSSPLTALPPLHTTPALTSSSDIESPATLATLATPSTTQSTYINEYFAGNGTSPRSSVKGKQPLEVRGSTGTATVIQPSTVLKVPSAQDHPRFERFAKYQHDRATESDSASDSMAIRFSRPRMAGATDSGNSRKRARSQKEKEKKALLSEALEKANAAVLLDNSQDPAAALEAYIDACNLLQQVLDRSSTYDDKRKLASIRATYTNRIAELRQLGNTLPAEEKTVSERPSSAESLSRSATSAIRAIDAPSTPPPPIPKDIPPIPPASSDHRHGAESAKVENSGVDPRSLASATGYHSSTEDSVRPEVDVTLGDPSAHSSSERLPSTRQDLEPQPIRPRGRDSDTIAIPPLMPQPLVTQSDHKYMPRPLSPRRPSAVDTQSGDEFVGSSVAEPVHIKSDPPQSSQHSRSGSGVSLSWLDTIDETARLSYSSSIHSRSSQHGVQRRPMPNTLATSNPDFDTAFDEAVEAAYNEGLEPDLDVLDEPREIEPASRRFAPQASVSIRASEIQEIWHPTDLSPPMPQMSPNLEDEEEERFLDEIASDFAGTFNFDFSSKSALPRESDSSGYSRDTWQSSMVSDRATASTSLSTVSEDTLPPRFAPKSATATSPLIPPAILESPESLAPPSAAAIVPRSPVQGLAPSASVRNRRLSGQNAKQLKIETSKSDARTRASTFHLSGSPFREDDEQKFVALQKTASSEDNLHVPSEGHGADAEHGLSLKSPPSLSLLTTVSDESRPATARTTGTNATDYLKQLEESEAEDVLTMRPTLFRKNKSFASLREHTILLSPTDNMPPINATPMSSTFMQYGLRRPEGPLTSQRAKFPSLASAVSDGSHASNVQLFDTSLISSTPLPASPRSPPGSTPLPVGLEPCPGPSLLRPFWLMRAILTTITHPKGGFITTRLFVPREVWRTQGVKLKSLEDKIGQCDLLTAALGRLALVDTYDADAIMEELQGFEEVMERVQAALSKKLGSDVGVHGVSSLFRDAAAAAASSALSSHSNTASATSADSFASSNTGSSTATGNDKSKGKEGKTGGYLNSWRKLRSKSSGAPLVSGGSSSGGSGGTNGNAHPPLPRSATGTSADGRDAGLMSSVPMTSFVPVERRGQRKDARVLAFDGPQKEYMASLARLLEGAQVLDQIARQVEDPGLKGTSPTHVGLELSTRHAAEFFGFYICRFALADLGILLDKYLKRGSEWVLG